MIACNAFLEALGGMVVVVLAIGAAVVGLAAYVDILRFRDDR